MFSGRKPRGCCLRRHQGLGDPKELGFHMPVSTCNHIILQGGGGLLIRPSA